MHNKTLAFICCNFIFSVVKLYSVNVAGQAAKRVPWGHRSLCTFPFIVRHANIPAFGGILPLLTPFPAIPRGIHEIPLLQMLLSIINRIDNYSTWCLSFKPEYALVRHQRASAMITATTQLN
jgi:hypothetical protein